MEEKRRDEENLRRPGGFFRQEAVYAPAGPGSEQGSANPLLPCLLTKLPCF
jgi:hypothetical protein